MRNRDRMLLILGVLLITLAFMVEIGRNRARLDDLEARITTFETVRIEYIAPADDSG